MEETKGRIVIGEDDRTHLRRAGKWAQFIAIVQFIGIGIGFIGALITLLAGGVAGASMSQIPGMPAGFFIWYPIFIILMLVLQFFLALFLIRFASRTLRAIEQGNDAVMTEAFANLGKYFRLMGIILIVTIALVILLLVGIFVFASAMASAF
jgi:hypothetical protein